MLSSTFPITVTGLNIHNFNVSWFDAWIVTLLYVLAKPSTATYARSCNVQICNVRKRVTPLPAAAMERALALSRLECLRQIKPVVKYWPREGGPNYVANRKLREAGSQ